MDLEKGFEKTSGIDLDFPEDVEKKEMGQYKVRFEPVSDDPRGDPSTAYPDYKLHVAKLVTVAFIIVAGLTALAVTLTMTGKDSADSVQGDNSTVNMTTTTAFTTMKQTTLLPTTTSSSTSSGTTTTSPLIPSTDNL